MASAGAGGSGASSASGDTEAYTVFVVGASGDLAHKKTYPSLFDLFVADLLPHATCIYGYARSAMAEDKFRNTIRGHLKEGTAEQIEAFLSKCFYRNGGYDDVDAFGKVGKSTLERH